MSQQRWKVRSLPIPRAADLGLARLLLGLVMQSGTYPGNVSDLAKRLNTTRTTVRRWRAELVDLGLVTDDGDRLHINDEAIQAWKAEQARKLAEKGIPWTSDALPWACLRDDETDAPRLTPTQMLAAAVLVGEAWCSRPGIRTDKERATIAKVGVSTVRQARDLLVAHELVEVELVRRGHARKLARLVWVKKAAKGSPLSQKRSDLLALRAARGRRRQPVEVVTQQRTEVVTQQRTPEPPTESPERRAPSRVVASTQTPAIRCVNEEEASEALRAGWGAKLETLAKRLRHRRPNEPKPQRNRTVIARELLNDQAAVKLARMDPRRACEQILMAAGSWLETRQKRCNAVEALVTHYGQHAVTTLLAVVADAVLDDVRDLGAVVAHRCSRLTTSKAQTAVAEDRRSWGLSRLLEAAREHAEVA
jgi:hypothetical protein